jgi:hypothetical protein
VIIAIAALLACDATLAAEDASEERAFTASVNGSYYALRDEPDFSIVVAAVNYGPFRIEARHNYEARHATSVFAGWKFAGGDGWEWEVTPIAGVLGGAERGGIVGVEGSGAHGPFDVYVEAEYVNSHTSSADSYFYAWTEAAWRPVEWLRIGIVGQRTRVVQTDRDIQRGPFAQVSYKAATLGVYAFNPDASSRYTVVSLALAF